MISLISSTFANLLVQQAPAWFSGYPLILAAYRRNASAASPVFWGFVYAGLIAVCVLVLVFIAMKLRAWLLDGSSDINGSGDIFSLSQLRELKDNGSISDEEFESAKRVLVAQGLQMLNSSSSDD
jgi:uncharacterized membrane protein